MVEVRIADGEADAKRAFELYRRMHAEEVVPGTFSPLKTMAHILRFMEGPGSVVLLAMDGEAPVGVLALAEGSLWYSEDSHWIGDKGFYVEPEHRDGVAARLLLDAAKKIGNDTELPVFITVNNGRRKRGARSGWERVGATLGYDNRATLAHFPEA